MDSSIFTTRGRNTASAYVTLSIMVVLPGRKQNVGFIRAKNDSYRLKLFSRQVLLKEREQSLAVFIGTVILEINMSVEGLLIYRNFGVIADNSFFCHKYSKF